MDIFGWWQVTSDFVTLTRKSVSPTFRTISLPEVNEKKSDAIYATDLFNDNWRRKRRQAEAWIMFLAGAVAVNAFAQGALRQFTQWLRIEHPTFQLDGRSTTELIAAQRYDLSSILEMITFYKWSHVEMRLHVIFSHSFVLSAFAASRQLRLLHNKVVKVSFLCFFAELKFDVFCEVRCVSWSSMCFRSIQLPATFWSDIGFFSSADASDHHVSPAWVFARLPAEQRTGQA